MGRVSMVGSSLAGMWPSILWIQDEATWSEQRLRCGCHQIVKMGLPIMGGKTTQEEEEEEEARKKQTEKGTEDAEAIRRCV